MLSRPTVTFCNNVSDYLGRMGRGGTKEKQKSFYVPPVTRLIKLGVN